AWRVRTASRKANVGIALDGDGDRCLLVDERGRLVDGDAILMILAQHARSEVELPKQRIVATVMSNRGLHRALRKSGVGIIEVGVGDRNVVEALRREGLGLGGEQSGHVILGARNEYIGDGMVTALAVLRVLVGSGKSLSQLTAPFESMPQILLNIPVDRKPPMESLEGVQARVREFEQELGEDGRILLRYSGTENLARVMVEGPDQGMIERQAKALADCVAEAIGKHD
ncbi:MAG TPA: phosphoglucosamine mutase, partial [Planctomycetota bacterium]|nr:phosphoglucosamine mutase [Planctomycetota bacterium]